MAKKPRVDKVLDFVIFLGILSGLANMRIILRNRMALVCSQSSCSISTRSDRRGFYTAIVTTIVVEKEDDKSAEPQQS